MLFSAYYVYCASTLHLPINTELKSPRNLSQWAFLIIGVMANVSGPSSSPSLLCQSQSTTISGGEFNNAAGDHNGLVVNIYQGGQIYPGNELPLAGGTQLDPLVSSGDSGADAMSNSTDEEIIPQGAQLDHSVTPEALSTDEREPPNARYERHLLVEHHGFPLWAPQPHSRLPLSYRRKGVSIGDVGIITKDGYFDFLFNICLPRGHASNPTFLPTNFSPVYLLPTDVSELRQHDSGSCLLTSTTERLRGLSFRCNGPEGSILVMPNGAYHEDLLNLHKFQRIAVKNAENWYKFAIGTCGRAIGNV